MPLFRLPARRESLSKMMKSERWDDVVIRLKEKAARDGAGGDEAAASAGANREDGVRRRSTRRSSSTSKTNFIGQNLLICTLVEHPKSVPADVVNKMIDLDYSSVSESDFLGNVALHVAANMGCPLDVVETLIERDPDMASTPNKEGLRPLHMAAAPSATDTTATLEVLATLFLADPVSVVTTDLAGRTPAVLARSDGSPPKVVHFLEQLADKFSEDMKRTEDELEAMAMRGEVVLPRGGITLEMLAEKASKRYKWRRGGCRELINLVHDRGGQDDNDASEAKSE